MTTEKDVKIHVKGLKKSFGHVHVLKGIDAEKKSNRKKCFKRIIISNEKINIIKMNINRK